MTATHAWVEVFDLCDTCVYYIMHDIMNDPKQDKLEDREEKRRRNRATFDGVNALFNFARFKRLDKNEEYDAYNRTYPRGECDCCGETSGLTRVNALFDYKGREFIAQIGWQDAAAFLAGYESQRSFDRAEIHDIMFYGHIGYSEMSARALTEVMDDKFYNSCFDADFLYIVCGENEHFASIYEKLVDAICEGADTEYDQMTLQVVGDSYDSYL